MSSKECGRGVFVRRMAWVLGVCLAVAVFLTGCELIRIEEGERTACGICHREAGGASR